MKTIKYYMATAMLSFCFFTISYRSGAQCTTLVYDPLSHSQTANPNLLILNLVSNFCANGTDASSDMASFEAAATFINQRGGNVELRIPAGTFYIGRQIPYGTQNNTTNAFALVNALKLNLCNNVKIVGEPNNQTKIRYVDSLKFGQFNTNGTPSYTTQFQQNDLYRADIGNTFWLENCSNVEIKDLELDGNSTGIQLGGLWGDKGRQCYHTGVGIYNSNSIQVNNLFIHDFGLDGININCNNPADTSNLLTHHIFVNNTEIKLVGRNGVSCVGGDNLNFTSCKLTESGRGTIATAPCAGVDFENESKSVVKHCTFQNCTFLKNQTSGVEFSPNSTSGIYDIKFENCNFVQTQECNNTIFAAFNSKDLKFNLCSFYGSGIIMAGDGPLNEHIGFNKCIFQDCYEGQPTRSFPLNQKLGTLLQNTSTIVDINNCVFNAFYLNTINFAVTSAYSFCDDAHKNSISNSIFNSYITTAIPSYTDAGLLRRTLLKSNNFNFFSTLSYNISMGCTGGEGNVDVDGYGKVLNAWPTGFSAPPCSNCIATVNITSPVYSGYHVFKASNNIAANSLIDLANSASVTTGSIKLTAGGSIELNPGFESNMAANSFIDAYIKPCTDVTAFGKTIQPIVRQMFSETNFSRGTTDKTKITCFPNPTSGSVSIQVDVAKSVLGSIYATNLQGQIVGEIELNKLYNEGRNTCRFNLGKLPAGIYIIIFESKKMGKIYCKVLKSAL